MKQHMLWSFKDHTNDKARIQEAILGFPSDFVITESPKSIGNMQFSGNNNEVLNNILIFIRLLGKEYTFEYLSFRSGSNRVCDKPFAKPRHENRKTKKYSNQNEISAPSAKQRAKK